MFRTQLSNLYVRDPPFPAQHRRSVRERHAEEYWIFPLVLHHMRIGNGKGRLVRDRENSHDMSWKTTQHFI